MAVHYFIKKSFFVVNILTVGLCAFLTAKAAGNFILAAMNTHLNHQKKGRVQSIDSHLSSPRTAGNARDIASILERNIFCSTCEATQNVNANGINPGDPPPLSPGQPTKSSLNLKLLATMTSQHLEQDNYAVILDPQSQRTQLYTIGSKVPGGALVVEITDHEVLLTIGERQEFLVLEAGEGAGPVTHESAAPYRGLRLDPRLAVFQHGIRRMSPRKFEVDRKAIDYALSNPKVLGVRASVVPVKKNGKPDGFKVFGERNAIGAVLGLWGGDKILSINGHRVTTPKDALETVRQLRNVNYIALTFERAGTRRTHEFYIR